MLLQCMHACNIASKFGSENKLYNNPVESAEFVPLCVFARLNVKFLQHVSFTYCLLSQWLREIQCELIVLCFCYFDENCTVRELHARVCGCHVLYVFRNSWNTTMNIPHTSAIPCHLMRNLPVKVKCKQFHCPALGLVLFSNFVSILLVHIRYFYRFPICMCNSLKQVNKMLLCIVCCIVLCIEHCYRNCRYILHSIKIFDSRVES